MKKLSRLAFVAALLVAMQMQSGAVIITTADGNGADTYLTNDGDKSGTTANGTATTMELRDLTGVRFRALYFRFDISAYSLDTIEDATITINGTTVNRSRDMIFMGLTDGSANENWDEATTTYDSASGFGAASNDGNFTLDGNLTAELARTSGSAVGLNTTGITAAMDAFLNADSDGLVTFAVYSMDPFNQSEDFYFETKEAGGSAAPTLTFAIPEPATLGLVGMFGAGLFAVRRFFRV